MNSVCEQIREKATAASEIEVNGYCAECGYDDLIVTISLDDREHVVGWTNECPECGEHEIEVTLDDLLGMDDDILRDKLHIDPGEQADVF